MFREHWRELTFWRWWWVHRASARLRAGVGLFLLALLLGGGLFLADRLSTAQGGTDSAAVVSTYVETVERLTTVREKGKTIRKLVPVVRKVRVVSHPRTVLQTRTSFRTLELTTKGKVRTVRQKVIRRVPVVKTRIVSVTGSSKTVAVTQFRPTTAIETRSQTVTNAQTIVNSQTVTNVQTVTAVQTVTNVVTQTNVETVQNTVTTTVPVTVTVTVPSP